METKIRILLAEDHAIVREGLKLLINAQPDMEVIGEVSDGGNAIQLAGKLRPDVILMDISMPEMDGIKATTLIQEQFPQLKVLTLTRHSDDGFLQQLIKAGGAGYILKQSNPAELLQAIHTVATGGKYLDHRLTGKVMDHFASKRTRSTGDLVALSDREIEVLQFISRGYSNKEIASHLQLSVKTVEVHKANAMKKLNMRSRIDIVRYALLKGWLQEL